MEQHDSRQYREVSDKSTETYAPPTASFIALKLEERLSTCMNTSNRYHCYPAYN